MVLIIYYGIFIRVDYKIREGNKIIFDNINDLNNANDANVALKKIKESKSVMADKLLSIYGRLASTLKILI